MTNETATPHVLPLDDTSATLERVGGKGASLARLASAGLPVPAGFQVTTAAYRRFVTENRLQDDILAAVSTAEADIPATLDAASQTIQELFARSSIPADLDEAIRDAYARLGGGNLPVAVRSSATAEDLPGLSFAGQQETYLNQQGAPMVLEAVKRCWASLWTARAIGYRARQGIAPADVSLAVVIQELVPADAAGILFTANPLTGARDEILINAAWGLGEAIVGGQVTPDTIVVDKATGAILNQDVATKDVMTVRTADGTREEPVPAERRGQPTLSPEQVSALARIGRQIEVLYGQPMDVEWASQGERIFVLQARPITALPESAAGSPATAEAEWALPNPRGRYMRGSVLELLPDPLSPLFATLGLPVWNRAMATLIGSLGDIGLPEEGLVTINGYGYYDTTFGPRPATKLLLALPRILAVEYPRLMRSARDRWQQARSRYGAAVDRWQSVNLASTSAEQLLDGVRDLTDEAAGYYLTIQSGILPAAYISESLFSLAYNRLFRRTGDPPAVTFLLGYASAPMRAEESLYDLAQWVREQPDLAATLEGMSSERFAAGYRAWAATSRAEEGWPEFWRRLSDYLGHFGHTIYDLDFAKPVLADDPGALLETLKYFVGGRAPNPRERQERAAEVRERAMRTFLSRLRGFRLRIFRRLSRLAQEFAPLREDALADVGLGWPTVRRMLAEVGRRLTASGVVAASDDVYWLTWDELRAAATALDATGVLAPAQAVVAERRATWDKERAIAPPVALPIKGGARFLGIDLSGVLPARTGQAEGNVLKGIAASPGQVTGPARVIHGPEEFDKMRPGDILVARITTPAWTSLFALAAGVVTDVGGPLSHSSIVAREYHIPAVLGTGTATERIRSGQRVTVDGSTGTLTVLDQAPGGPAGKVVR